ncbi:GNAT family N-acetyltransferase [Bacillus glycinifermentans]|uniref:GCN5 family acetyltransferase n=1 Tax=Bacillus glycinifermentans TaxID=1664069 RepID=A0A0T6BNJ3_9BACI|nr:GNAT family protein [Bacillus glycinifermentans]ATH95013.1 N-acetyltransferase [Bacillus glycinifermentans]KRT93203.1 GCN5 family acetyltransferase [Bacillus glycinifermentans]MEC0487619.1 GNAT family protein [Bacillus glycinifermentans]
MNSICGDKVKLRQITMDDVPELWTMIYGTKKPEWKKWDAPYFPLQPEPYQYFAESFVPLLKEKPPRYAAIEIDGRFKGTISYYWECRPTRWLECGIVIYDPQFWNGGYGTEAVKLWVGYLFENTEVARIGMTTWSGNARMMKCAEKAGFTLEGRLRKVRYYDGVYYDSIRYGILREEWEHIYGEGCRYNK